MDVRNSKLVSGTGALRRSDGRGKLAVSSAAAPAVREPAATIMIAGVPEDELTPRVRDVLLGLMGEVDHLRRQLEDAQSRISYLERLADEDALMPIANRRAFVRELSRMLSFAERYGTPVSIVYFDLNGLKRINDEHGHAAGDAALQHVARTLVESIRNSDIVGRLGGDEFGVLLVQTDEETARRKAETLAVAIATRPLLWQGQEIALSAAYGTHSFTGAENAASVLDAADRAMYDCKRAGRER
jgi:diguanylate cyclase (GGDEF)-like protein